MQDSACLVDACVDYNCFGEVSFFVVSKVKLKEAATETFGLLESA
jgi:hypothetical protein